MQHSTIYPFALPCPYSFPNVSVSLYSPFGYILHSPLPFYFTVKILFAPWSVSLITTCLVSCFAIALPAWTLFSPSSYPPHHISRIIRKHAVAYFPLDSFIHWSFTPALAICTSSQEDRSLTVDLHTQSAYAHHRQNGYISFAGITGVDYVNIVLRNMMTMLQLIDMWGITSNAVQGTRK